MTADQVCQAQEEKTQARPCPDSHPAVSSTPPVEGPLLVTCPWATPTQAACRHRPLSRQVPLSTATVMATATATLTTSSTTSITQHHSPLAPYPFRSLAALWNDPVLCLHPALESAAATIVVAATQATTMTRYAHAALSLTKLSPSSLHIKGDLGVISNMKTVWVRWEEEVLKCFD